MLIEDYADKVDDEGKRLLNIIRGNTKKMSDLIDNLLDLSRIGHKDIDHTEIDTDKLAKAVFDEIKATVPERELQFDIKPLPPAYGDEGLLRQVFFNLLFNAIKFTRSRENAIIEVGGHVEGLENVYYVKDNGVGFDMQYADKLFGTFQRLHSDKEFEGTGIGLAIVQRIINRHGGRIWAEGKVNEGAIFYFTLPKRSSKN
jgi:two-component system sensor kinase